MECLPVAAFGNPALATVRVATVGYTPKLEDWKMASGWKPRATRLAHLAEDYQLTRRGQLSDEDVNDARDRARGYFLNENRHWHVYFEELDEILRRINGDWSYARGTAAHVDLVACVTSKSFRYTANREQLLSNCHSHFENTVKSLPAGTRLLVNGFPIMEHLGRKGANVEQKEERKVGSSTFHVGTIQIAGRLFPWACAEKQLGAINPASRVLFANWIRERWE